MDWFRFQLDQKGSRSMQRPHLMINQQPSFTEIPGRILGLATQLSRAQLAIDRGVLGVPGTPFALILSRSLEFRGYDALMLLNFTIIAMYGSLSLLRWHGTLWKGRGSNTCTNPFPRMLLQAGLEV
jgi:hypothetical protein